MKYTCLAITLSPHSILLSQRLLYLSASLSARTDHQPLYARDWGSYTFNRHTHQSECSTPRRSPHCCSTTNLVSRSVRPNWREAGLDLPLAMVDSIQECMQFCMRPCMTEPLPPRGQIRLPDLHRRTLKAQCIALLAHGYCARSVASNVLCNGKVSNRSQAQQH